ncbi:hypothetical protein BK008_03590 [Methanobacterium sp. MZ-A1]|nr:hypothetical protein BK008_03590 [Methanobacterium sp. MZ-A1]
MLTPPFVGGITPLPFTFCVEGNPPSYLRFFRFNSLYAPPLVGEGITPPSFVGMWVCFMFNPIVPSTPLWRGTPS